LSYTPANSPTLSLCEAFFCAREDKTLSVQFFRNASFCFSPSYNYALCKKNIQVSRFP